MIGKTEKLLRYSYLSALHLLSRRSLPRTPEPCAVTEDIDDVSEYDRVMSTVMALPYALALTAITRARAGAGGGRALDLCCGPGLFTLLVQRKLGYREVLGVDLSKNMIETAERNALATGRQKEVGFHQGSVFDLSDLPRQPFDLVTFCNGAHQFTGIDEVVRVLEQAEQVVTPEGLIFVLDPVRQKTARLTDGYLRVAGEDYVRQGMPAFYRQFQESLHASWTPRELAGAVPHGTGRRWVQILPNGLPTFQILLGLPARQERAYRNPAPGASELRDVIPAHAKFDWKLMSMAFVAGSCRPLAAPT